MRHQLLCISLLLLSLSSVNGQVQDSSATPIKHGFLHKEAYGKNIIRFNPVGIAVLRDTRNVMFGYERLLHKNQSISLNIGYLFVPTFVAENSEILNSKETGNFGYVFSLDYRFYLLKLNTRPAMNGVYIGPYYSYYHNETTRNLTFLDNSTGSPITYEGKFSSNFNMQSLGIQVGYQFILWKRLSFDLIMSGPSLTYYDIEMDLTSQLSPDETLKFYQTTLGKLVKQTPLLGNLFNSGSADFKGRTNLFYAGYRYTLNIGYHF